MLTRRWRPLALIVVLALLIAAAAVQLTRASGSGTWEVTADFADTTGVYVGNEVQYLGVPVGEITEIEPRGTVMRVRMAVDDDIRIPRDAGAEILQAALLTDRYVSLGPAYRGGPALEPGAHIAAQRTRAPISFDDLGAAIDDLVVALDQEGPDGRDIGDLLAVTADNLDGNGARIRRLLSSSEAALASINAKEPDLHAIARNLVVIARLVGKRDATVRRFTRNLSGATDVVAGQAGSLDRTLRSLATLTQEVSGFVDENRSALRANLRDVATVAATIRQQQGELSRIFDHMPTGAENIARAFDPGSRSMRVQMVARTMLLFSPGVRQAFCQAVLGPACGALTNSQGTGLLDLVIDGAEAQIPGGH